MFRPGFSHRSSLMLIGWCLSFRYWFLVDYFLFLRRSDFLFGYNFILCLLPNPRIFLSFFRLDWSNSWPVFHSPSLLLLTILFSYDFFTMFFLYLGLRVRWLDFFQMTRRSTSPLFLSLHSLRIRRLKKISYLTPFPHKNLLYPYFSSIPIYVLVFFFITSSKLIRRLESLTPLIQDLLPEADTYTIIKPFHPLLLILFYKNLYFDLLTGVHPQVFESFSFGRFSPLAFGPVFWMWWLRATRTNLAKKAFPDLQPTPFTTPCLFFLPVDPIFPRTSLQEAGLATRKQPLLFIFPQISFLRTSPVPLERISPLKNHRLFLGYSLGLRDSFLPEVFFS